MKKKILILTYYYVPGFKGGGPIQSIKNMVDNLSDEFEFFILNKDRDLGDSKPYTNIKCDEWQNIGNSNIYYMSEDKFNIKHIFNLIKNTEYDILYVNSFFGVKLVIPALLCKILNIMNGKKVILAPRGEFSEGALSIKSIKKNMYIKLFKLFNFHKDIIWHATAKNEEQDIINILGDNIEIRVAGNLTSNNDKLIYDKSIDKEVGNLKIIFLSRISPKKNLLKAIQLLSHIKGNVIFDIYGPKEDELYWNKCQQEINKLNNNVNIIYKGAVDNCNVNEIFKQYHILLFPTLGENFGHVISEALIGGCPIIISDQTPWRDLERNNVGYDLPLDNDKKFIEAIQKFIDMNKKEYMSLSINAFNYGKKISNSNKSIERTKLLFK